tara:strand:- start:15890 stop:16741 length:852 start_codon:yes stop_codon:yes gene_type:complete
VSKFFADAEESFEESKFVIYGYPYDGTACFRKGTAKAPDAIREQSFNFETNLMELGVDLVDVPANDWGNIELGENQEENNSRIKSLVSEIISNNKFPIGLGGEHSLTPPVIEAMVEKYPNLNVLIMDAHLDFRDGYEGNHWSHASTTRRIFDLLGPNNIWLLGVRSASSTEVSEARASKLNYTESGWVDLREHLADMLDLFQGPLYLSLDMDVIDPAFAPGIGTPEPFGMTPYEVVQTINFVSDNLVGFDCVEVCPPFDNGNTSALAARLTRHLMGIVHRIRN